MVKTEDVETNHLEAITKGFLNPGFSYDWHTHQDIDEVFIVLKGEGMFYFEKEETKYAKGDVFITPPNSNHKITAKSQSEFYFIRVKV